VGLPNQGLVIISEFISSARVMRGGLNVNPWRVREVPFSATIAPTFPANCSSVCKHCGEKTLLTSTCCGEFQVKLALHRSLEMDPHERADRMRRNLEYSKRLTTNNWATQVLSDLKSVEKSDDPDSSFAVGFGMHYKIMDLKAGFNPLDVKEVCKNYRTARHRLILLDWGGTLVAAHEKADKLQMYAMATGHAERDSLPPELGQVLEDLAADPKNYVFVVTGKEQPAVAQYFGGIRGLGLGAEHGFYYKWPREEEPAVTPNGKSLRGMKWQTIMEVGDQSWKEVAKVVMNIFVQRTYGTYIETKGNALIWQFSEADPEFGYMQSKELVDHLVVILAPYPVEVIRGGGVSDGYIEVRPTGANKGLFLEHCVSTMRSIGQEADFVLAVGDDSSDEPMFQAIGEHLRELRDQSVVSAYGVTVGKKPTAASAYIDDPAAVLELLVSLSKCSNKEKKFFSALDLPSQAGQLPQGMPGFAAQQEYSAREETAPQSVRSVTAVHLVHLSLCVVWLCCTVWGPTVSLHFSRRHQPETGTRECAPPFHRAPAYFVFRGLQNPRKSITLASPDSGAEEEKKRTGNGGELQRINSAMNLSMKDYMKGYARAASFVYLRVSPC
jgi:trehalose-phosphatase